MFKVLLTFYMFAILCHTQAGNNRASLVEEISDQKTLKQLLRTRTNVMVLFSQGKNPNVMKTYKEAAAQVKGIGSLVMVDCAGGGQKLCRQMKASPETHVMHHFKDGKFHKVYDRLETTKSLVRFMNDPSGDKPWEEEESGKSVVHLDGPTSLQKLLKKHKKVLIMFYAPWCVYCKHMKPEYVLAAEKVKSLNLGVLAAMDVVRTENSGMRTKYNITGFPTVHYFKNGEIVATYEGDNKQDKIVEFMKDPLAVPVKAKEKPWSEELSDVHHLTNDNFDQFIQDNPSILVMFYAPWCGHCKNLKPEWIKAATTQKTKQSEGKVAAVDATKETKLAERFKVKGFPTIKYFKDGEFAFDTSNLRDHNKIVNFLQDPKEPPPAPPPEPNWSDVASEVVHLTDDNFKSQLRSKRHALVMFYAPWCGHCKAAKPEFEAAAEQLKEESRMVLAAVNCVEHQAVCKIYDVKGYPTFKYLKYHKDATSYDGGRKTVDFVNFMRTLEPESVTKSEPVQVPEVPSSTGAKEDKASGNNETPSYPGWSRLIHLTDENYKIVFLEHKHLFILFHAKWCGNCTDMKPMFASIAESHDSSLGTLAACDADLAPNMVDVVMVDSLPTFTYVRAGKPVTNYSGERTAQSLKEFLKTMKNLNKDEL